MFRVDRIHVLRAARMAGQAAFIYFFGGMLFKAENWVLGQRLRNRVIAVGRLDRVRVCFPRTMTGLASMYVILVWKSDVPVSSSFIMDRFVFMALSALLWSRKLARGGTEIRRRTRHRYCLLLRESPAQGPSYAAEKQNQSETQQHPTRAFCHIFNHVPSVLARWRPKLLGQVGGEFQVD